MKALPTLLALFPLWLAAPLRAQENAASAAAETVPALDLAPARPAEPRASTGRPLDLMPAQPELAPPATDSTLIPETPATVGKPRGGAISQPKKAKKSATEAAEGAMAQRVRLRQAKTRAMRDPAVQAEWQRSESARTEFDRRETLKRFYTLLYSRMGKLDGSLKKDLAQEQAFALRRLTQTRIEATETPDADRRTARFEGE